MDNWGQGTFTLSVSRLYRHAVTVPHDEDISPCVRPPPSVGPPRQDIVQADIRRSGTEPPPWRCPFCLLVPVPLFQHARFQPLPHLACKAPVPNPRLDALHQPFVVKLIQRSCMLMRPSRTRMTCQRNNIAPRLAGENVQHIDILYIIHSAFLYDINIISYMISLFYVNRKL